MIKIMESEAKSSSDGKQVDILDQSKEVRLLIEQLRTANRERHFTRANLYNDSANHTQEGLRNLLVTIAVLLFTFTSPILTNKFGDSSISLVVKTLLVISWATSFFSVVLGLIQVAVDVKFQLGSARRESEAERIWSKSLMTYGEYTKATDEASKLYGLGFSDISNSAPLVLQVGFLLFSFTLSIIAAGLVLFKV